MKRYIIILITLLTLGDINAQDNTVKINLDYIGVISNDKEISGYYIYYRNGKASENQFSYTLEILNENTELVANHQIIGGRYLSLNEASYNGNLLCFKFFDYEKRIYIMKYYNKDAIEVYDEDVTPSSFELESLLLTNGARGSYSSKKIIPIQNTGFLMTSTIKQDKIGYSLAYYPDDANEGIWEYGSDGYSENKEYATVLEANKDIIVLNFITKGKKWEYSLLVLDTKKGKLKSKIELEDKKFDYFTHSLYNEISNELTLFGQRYKKEYSPYNRSSKGISINTYNEENSKIDSKFYSWEDDILKLLEDKGEIQIKNFDKIHFHKFIEIPNEGYFAIAETINFSFGSNSTKGVGSFYIFEFDTKKEIKNVKIIEKPFKAGFSVTSKQSILLDSPNRYNFVDAKIFNNDKTLAILYKNDEIMGLITRTEGEYMVDEIDVSSKASLTKVLPAKEANILLIEFFKKDKKFTKTFKKFNF